MPQVFIGLEDFNIISGEMGMDPQKLLHEIAQRRCVSPMYRLADRMPPPHSLRYDVLKALEAGPLTVRGVHRAMARPCTGMDVRQALRSLEDLHAVKRGGSVRETDKGPASTLWELDTVGRDYLSTTVFYHAAEGGGITVLG